MSLDNVISKLKNNKELYKEDIHQIYTLFERKEINNDQIKELILGWNDKSITSRELFCLASFINNKQNQHILTEDAVDMCGTGGDKLNTFNISTLSAIVASSCGLKVIKHSGRATTSIQGSVDILNSFGIGVDILPKALEKCFSEKRLLFTSSKLLRETFGNVKLVCKQLGMPGFVNMLGPLTNPYKTNYHLMGVSSIKWGRLMAESLKHIGVKRAFIVCSKVAENKYLDELSFCGENYIWELIGDEIKEKKFIPSEFGMDPVDISELTIKDENENKLLFEEILKGKINGKKVKYSRMDVVALNTGAALFLMSKVKSIKEGYEHSLLHIQSGKAWEHFYGFINCIKSNGI